MQTPNPLFLSYYLLFFGRNLALESLLTLLIIFVSVSLCLRDAIQFVLHHPFSFPQ